MIIIPIKHQNMTARRWPVITIALIVLNAVVFLATHGTLQNDAPELGHVKAHILILAATHPELKLTPDAQTLVANFRKQNEFEWKRIQDPNHEIIDVWDAQMRLVEDPGAFQKEMDKLCSQYEQLMTASFAEKYAFVPAHPSTVSYITANFLHGGWLHLIFNMWFLWLAGFVLEDAWGRPLYAIFYLVAGMAALQIHAWMNPGSIIACLGASGAVAGLMGAFMVRFPKLKIDMAWLFGFRLYRFQAEAIWLLPLWLLTEIFYGTLFGQTDGVAHWAHVGGFVFGALSAVAIRTTGLEKTVNKTIEQKIDPAKNFELDRANDFMQHGKLDEAMVVLNSVLAGNPNSVDALRMLREIHFRRTQTEEYQETTSRIIGAYLHQKMPEAALESYEEFKHSGGDKLSPSVWLNLCRSLEEKELFERALTEYGLLIAAHPTAQQSITAQVAAGRMCLKKLGRPQDALKFYKAAEASNVPHLDMEYTIAEGIKEANFALGNYGASAKAGANK